MIVTLGGVSSQYARCFAIDRESYKVALMILASMKTLNSEQDTTSRPSR